MNPKTFAVVVVSSQFLFLGAAFAQKVTLDADVFLSSGHPASPAGIRVDRTDKKMQPLIMKADAHGHVAALQLEPGTYQVTAGSQRGFQTQVIKVQNQPVHLQFDMSKSVTAKPVKKKYYYGSMTFTGSHIPRHYSTEEEAKAEQTEVMSGEDLQKYLQQSSFARPGSGTP